jgi:hypothetical protein
VIGVISSAPNVGQECRKILNATFHDDGGSLEYRLDGARHGTRQFRGSVVWIYSDPLF